MKTLIITNLFHTPEENLATEEFLFLSMENYCDVDIIFRIWECNEYFIVLGSSQIVREEVYLERCLQEHIKILRRCSAGGTVLQGPGCINYSLIFNLNSFPQLRNIRESYTILLSKLTNVFKDKYGLDTHIEGISDICINNKKVSGNAQRRNSKVLLHHGTLLYSVNYDLMERLIKLPQKQPEYRLGRTHREFVGCLPLSKQQIIDVIYNAFVCNADLISLSKKEIKEIEELVLKKYGTTDWNFRR